MANGFHKLKAVIHDVIENTGENSINFNYLVDTDSPIAYITAPTSSAEIPESSFPYTIKAFAYDPIGISSISFYYIINDQSSLIGTVNNPSNQNVTLDWEKSPGKNTYKIYLTVKNTSGDSTKSDYITVIIQ